MKLFIALSLLVTPICALEFSIKGETLSMSGPVSFGDGPKFEQFMAQTTHSSVKRVVLNSTGGSVRDAVEIGRIVRKKRLTTYIDASRQNCASACTVIFASGVERVYVNSNNIKDGVYAFSFRQGLGYHEGNAPLSRDKNKYSGAATAQMISGYYEFGSSGAKDIITLAPPNKLYRISGETALTKGIATRIR